MTTLTLTTPFRQSTGSAETGVAEHTSTPEASQPRITPRIPPAPRRVARWLGKALVNLTLLAAVAGFLGLAVGPHVFGYRTMTMLTGSMAPLINPGDVTIVTPLPATEVKPGMIISYHIPVDDHRVVSHRVVDVTHTPEGAIAVQTKGDANPGNDPWTATLQGDTVYQVRGVVPALGTAIRFLRTPVLQKVLLYGMPTLLAGWVLVSLWAPRKNKNTAA